jgi:hypothetical protein
MDFAVRFSHAPTKVKLSMKASFERSQLVRHSEPANLPSLYSASHFIHSHPWVL